MISKREVEFRTQNQNFIPKNQEKQIKFITSDEKGVTLDLSQVKSSKTFKYVAIGLVVFGGALMIAGYFLPGATLTKVLMGSGFGIATIWMVPAPFISSRIKGKERPLLESAIDDILGNRGPRHNPRTIKIIGRSKSWLEGHIARGGRPQFGPNVLTNRTEYS